MVGAVAAALTLASCAAPTPERRETRAVPRGPLLAIGDSILVGARDFGELGILLGQAGWTPEIVAEEGRTVSWATEVVAARASVPEVVVAVLGSNPGSSTEGFDEEARAFVAALTQHGATLIVWIPPAHADPERYAGRREILSGLGPPVEVASWQEVVSSNPHWLSGDGLHLSGEGYAALAASIVDALA